MTNEAQYLSPLQPPCPDDAGTPLQWGRLYGSGEGLAIASAAQQHEGPVIVITPDTPTAYRLDNDIRFYIKDKPPEIPVLIFPDWETLPYDVFSPHQDIISKRLETLYCLPNLRRGIVIVSVTTVMHRLAPAGYVNVGSLMLDVGDTIYIAHQRRTFEANGYTCVSQVMEHGEFAVRGSLIDLYPMGSEHPYRIDLLDNEIESIRTFDPETQRTIEHVNQIHMLPAREFPLTEESITRFRQAHRALFESDPQSSIPYQDISNGIATQGIEYYLPMFFEKTESFFNYLPDSCLLITSGDIGAAADNFWNDTSERYEQGRYNLERPLLSPDRLFIGHNEIRSAIDKHKRVVTQHFEIEDSDKPSNFATGAIPHLNLSAPHTPAGDVLVNFKASYSGRILFVAESMGRREILLGHLNERQLFPDKFDHWHDFLQSNSTMGLTIAPLEDGLMMESPAIAVIAESQLFGDQVRQRRRRKPAKDTDTIVQNLTELNIGAPVVHEEHGVGRYQGLQRLTIDDMDAEFLTLEYAGGDKLYVLVSSLHLISRYTGAAPEKAPLHKLGGDQWLRARRKASERVRDVAAELLDLYARRAARKGHAFSIIDDQYANFASAFPFEETPDQEEAINDVLTSMQAGNPMDRLICGDVGFGKTEVAMRAAFVAVQENKQVMVLVPTTLLAQQHFDNFTDRFADWPVRIEMLSRFRTGKQLTETIKAIEQGKVDIVIGTHKLLQEGIKFKNPGLVIIDEEHRFGVRQKERLKTLRSEIDVLTLTATPIPRTLNMALSDLRELSIISTPPTNRLAVKTFVREWDGMLIQEACLREIKRGGQVYFLHNEVKTIEEMAEKIRKLVPEANVHVAHGQMRERELEHIMQDFYHQRFNVLVCTTIIETGIDVPTANTIIMNRADKFGLAQLYQLRGRVGRSHHRAYAYLIVPPQKVMTADAVKRLEAIESLEELGAGFMLATHDLEIRGAGELLGDEQSGQIHEIGFTLYTELLERTITALRSGKDPDLDLPMNAGTEINLHVPALIPDDYLPDVHSRLIMYKRISNASSNEELRELQVEMIDRFGLLPDAIKTLFRITELKLKATPLGVLKIDASSESGRITFTANADINTEQLIRLIQEKPNIYKLDKQTKLRFIQIMPDAQSRVETIDKLLDSLAL